jgi:hypothetical protein
MEESGGGKAALTITTTELYVTLTTSHLHYFHVTDQVMYLPYC